MAADTNLYIHYTSNKKNNINTQGLKVYSKTITVKVFAQLAYLSDPQFLLSVCTAD